MDFKNQNIYSPKIAYDDNRNIYLKQNQVVFFLTPKTGSTSLKTIISKKIGLGNYQNKITKLPNIPNHLLYQHQTIYKVGFVRNPFDRLVSLYTGAKEHNKMGIFLRNNLDSTSFDLFLRGICNIPDSVSDRHFKSQYIFLTTPTGEFLLNDLVRFESYQEDLMKVFSKVGISIEAKEIAHKNKSTHQHYAQFYTPELVELANKRYKIDLQLFGYKFGEPLAEDLKNQWQRPITEEVLIPVLQYKAKALFKEYYKYKESNTLGDYSFAQVLKIKFKQKIKSLENKWL